MDFGINQPMRQFLSIEIDPTNQSKGIIPLTTANHNSWSSSPSSLETKVTLLLSRYSHIYLRKLEPAYRVVGVSYE
jgi:hypothetical protein